MGYGAIIDRIAGGLSHALHLRATRIDTSGDLAPYLDLPFAELFPAPPSVSQVKRIQPSFRMRSRVMETLRWTSAHRPLCPHYRQRHETLYAKNLTAYARWLHPRKSPRKSILLYVHGWLEPGSWVEELTLLPLWYRELGVDVAHIQLPFHGRRSPRGQLFHGEWFWTADMVRSIEAVRQSVMDVRSAMGYFRDQGYEEIGITGPSLGGSIAMLTACLEPLPDYIIPMFCHLDLGTAIEEAPILWRIKSDLDHFGISAFRRHELFQRISISNAVPLLAPERQLWVAARDDGYLKSELVQKQWEQWGSPPIFWASGGHMTLPLVVPAVTQRMKAVPRLASSEPS